MRRIVLVCEVLHPPLDEGVRILAAEIASALARRCDVTLLGSIDSEVRGVPVRGVLTDRYFIGRSLARAIAEARPEAILYIPWTSLTPRTFFRVAILKRRARGAPVGVLAVQPRGSGAIARLAARWGRPDRIFVFGPEVQRQVAAIGLTGERLEGGVDLDRFRPRGEESLADLRRATGLPVSPYIVLHVGHLKASRGVLALKAVQALEGVQAVLACSTSTAAESETRRILQHAGVRVLDWHLPNIQEIYRAADCYLFPVTSSVDAIELPLSVLEAMACNLPIVTTKFGGLPALLEGPHEGVVFLSSEEEIPRVLISLRRDRPRPRLRERVSPLTWEAMAGKILASLAEAAGRPAAREEEAR